MVVDNTNNRYWNMRNGYCLPCTTRSMGDLGRRLKEDAALYAAAYKRVCVGIHWRTEVTSLTYVEPVMASNESGEEQSGGGGKQMVCQVFVSALPVAYAKDTPSKDWTSFASLLLDAAFDATLAAAHTLLLKQRRNAAVATSNGGSLGESSNNVSGNGGHPSFHPHNSTSGGFGAFGDSSHAGLVNNSIGVSNHIQSSAAGSGGGGCGGSVNNNANSCVNGGGHERHDRIKVFLTAVGGGAFGNRIDWIVMAIGKALRLHRHAPLDVKLVHFSGVIKSAFGNINDDNGIKCPLISSRRIPTSRLNVLPVLSNKSPRRKKRGIGTRTKQKYNMSGDDHSVSSTSNSSLTSTFANSSPLMSSYSSSTISNTNSLSRISHTSNIVTSTVNTTLSPSHTKAVSHPHAKASRTDSSLPRFGAGIVTGSPSAAASEKVKSSLSVSTLTSISMSSSSKLPKSLQSKKHKHKYQYDPLFVHSPCSSGSSSFATRQISEDLLSSGVCKTDAEPSENSGVDCQSASYPFAIHEIESTMDNRDIDDNMERCQSHPASSPSPLLVCSRSAITSSTHSDMICEPSHGCDSSDADFCGDDANHEQQVLNAHSHLPTLSLSRPSSS